GRSSHTFSPPQLKNLFADDNSITSPNGDTLMTINNLEQIQRIDAENMLSHIDALPDQLASARPHGQSLDLPAGAADVQQVVISGMGGSAISADLLAALIADTCPVPISVVRGYGLPAHVRGPETLVIALSHSGGTEEKIGRASCRERV